MSFEISTKYYIPVPLKQRFANLLLLLLPWFTETFIRLPFDYEDLMES